MPSALAIISAVCRHYVLHASPLHNFVPNIFKELTLEVGVELNVGFRVKCPHYRPA